MNSEKFYSSMDNIAVLRDNIKKIISVQYKELIEYINELPCKEEARIGKNKLDKITRIKNTERNGIGLFNTIDVHIKEIRLCCGAFELQGQTDAIPKGDTIDELLPILEKVKESSNIETFLDKGYSLLHDVYPLIIREAIKYNAQKSDKLYIIANDRYSRRKFLRKIGLEISEEFKSKYLSRDKLCTYSSNLDYFREMPQYKYTDEYNKRVKRSSEHKVHRESV